MWCIRRIRFRSKSVVGVNSAGWKLCYFLLSLQNNTFCINERCLLRLLLFHLLGKSLIWNLNAFHRIKVNSKSFQCCVRFSHGDHFIKKESCWVLMQHVTVKWRKNVWGLGWWSHSLIHRYHIRKHNMLYHSGMRTNWLPFRTR